MMSFIEKKKEAHEELVTRGINVDLVPIAIQLHQLNETLDDDHKLNPDDLNMYINAVYNQHLKKIGKEGDKNRLGNAFNQLIQEPSNQAEYRYKEQDIPATAEGKQLEMKKLLGKMGLKETILEKNKAPEIPSQTAQEALGVGKSLINAGVGNAITKRPALNFAQSIAARRKPPGVGGISD